MTSIKATLPRLHWLASSLSALESKILSKDRHMGTIPYRTLLNWTKIHRSSLCHQRPSSVTTCRDQWPWGQRLLAPALPVHLPAPQQHNEGCLHKEHEQVVWPRAFLKHTETSIFVWPMQLLKLPSKSTFLHAEWVTPSLVVVRFLLSYWQSNKSPFKQNRLDPTYCL